MKLTRLYPEIHVTDVEPAARFFEDLGFVRGYELRENGTLDFVVMEYSLDEKMIVMLHHMLRDDLAKSEKPGRLYFDTDDVRALQASMKAKGHAITEPEETDYGAILCRVQGPDGYWFWFQQWK